MAPDEWKKLKVLDRVFQDQKRLVKVQVDRELASGDDWVGNKNHVYPNDILKERNIWVAMN